MSGPTLSRDVADQLVELGLLPLDPPCADLGEPTSGLLRPGLDGRRPHYDLAVKAVEASAATASSAVPVLLATKLRAPALRPGLVPRHELSARLVAERQRKLTLVCAPAGWGKSTLLGAWAASPAEVRPFAWLSLEPSDHDVVRFWSYVLAALRSVRPDLEGPPPAALGSAGPDLVDVVVAPLINELTAIGEPLVLVLDDYHFVRSEPVHASVAFLVRHLPPNMHLAIASRADPPLPLAALRAAGQLMEIRAADLRFTETEAEELLNGSLGLGLEPADVELLRARAEGWAAGLQLAALSARGLDDPHAFAVEFSGEDRQIADYLREVLAEEPPERREFLLGTSILERLCASLCDAVTGRADGAGQLEAIERANLFLVSLDSRREWYRYHHLFRDLLRDELARRSPELQSDLHRRASTWHRERGNVDDAIHHATAAGHFDDAGDLIARHWYVLWNLGQRATVARWIDALPREIVLADARICLARGWIALAPAMRGEVELWAGAAELAPLPGPLFDGSTSVAEGVARLRSTHAFFTGDTGLGIRQGRLAMTLAQQEEASDAALAGYVLGINLSFRDEPAAAAGLLEAALPSLVPPATRIALLGRLAVTLADSGEIDRATRAAAEAEQLVEELRLHELVTVGVLYLARGKLLELRGDTDAAQVTYTRAITLARRGERRLDLAHALLASARLERSRGAHAEARTLIREARAVLSACPDPGRLADLLAKTERALQLTGTRRAVPEVAADVQLSERELTVLRLLASDLSQREIGSELYISLNTVKGHTRSIFRKLGVSSRADAVARGRELALL